MSELGQDKLYELVLSKVFPRQMIEDIQIRYYGEEYREYIKERNSKIDVLL